MLELLLISLTLLATCYFGFWQMFLVPRRKVLQTRLEMLNALRISHRPLFAQYTEGQEWIAQYELDAKGYLQEAEAYGALFDHIFLDERIDRNKDLPDAAKQILLRYRNTRVEGPPTIKAMFADLILGMSVTQPVESDFEELSVLIEYTIKKIPYRPFPRIDPYPLFRPLMRRLMPTRVPSSR